ncbi:MAG TPA: heme A synthase [Bacteroidetes bacterium]|nr:heme A synthase [Bacteroidota bacterium]
MQSNSYKPVIIWLYTGVVLIIMMVAVGGLVRLNNSGLSIVEWNPVTGIIPPLNQEEWQYAFDQYKKIPEFAKEHKHFDLNDFKVIYLWEYFHRLIARLIGFIFLIPFLIFWYKGYFKNKALFRNVVLIFFFALFQAWLGWYMVTSGFTKLTDVSHYRLAVHLFVATLLGSFVLWTAHSLKFASYKSKYIPNFKKYTLLILIVLIIQIFYGAFTAGLNAGYYYSDYPTMSGQWFPVLAKKAYLENGFMSFLNDPSMVHFIHRWFAIVVLTLIILYYYYFKNKVNTLLKKWLNLAILLIIIQISLGILTVLTHINITLAILHQVNAILLFMTFVSILFLSWKKKTS